MVKVTNIPGAYSFEGKSYGPFSATNKKEFVEVPADFAATMNLPLHESELAQAQDEIQPEGLDIQELLDANQSLKEELDSLRAEYHDMLGHSKSLAVEHLAVKQQLEDARIDSESVLSDSRILKADLDSANTELESTQSDFIRYQNDLPGLRARVAELEAGATAEPEGKPAAAAKKASKA